MLQNGELETAWEMAVALSNGDVSSYELVERSLRRAESWQPLTNAFSQLWPEDAVAAARRVDAGGRVEDRPFAGVPIAVKDLFDVAGRETTGCSVAYRGNVAVGDAPTISSLLRAGLVIVGKTNQHELAAGGTNVVSACGRTGNPWDPQRITGGSSGGSAAAIASGVVPWALGSDTGGSVRIPASLCGIFGLKPTTGSLSIEGMLPLAPSLDCPGPMAATTADIGALQSILAGSKGRDRVSTDLLRTEKESPVAGEASSESVHGFRLGLPGGFFFHNAHPEARAAVDSVATTLEAAGAAVDVVGGTGIDDTRHVWKRVAYSEFAAAHPALRARLHLLHPETERVLRYGQELDAQTVGEAARRRSEIGAWFRDRLTDFDALVVQTTPYAAPRWDQEVIDAGGRGTIDVNRVGPGWFTCAINLAGLPAISVPAARSSEGLPVGVSFVGRDGEEDRLVRLADLWRTVSGFRPAWPALPAGATATPAEVPPAAVPVERSSGSSVG